MEYNGHDADLNYDLTIQTIKNSNESKNFYNLNVWPEFHIKQRISAYAHTIISTL